MRVVMLGISHQTAPVELREKLALTGDRLDQAVAALRARHPEIESAFLSTCNRVELYIARPVHEPPNAEDLRRFLAEFCGADFDALTAASIQRENDQAIAHLFRVASGLESMVLGEPQVLGQVKRAYDHAMRCGAVGPVLHTVFQDAITIAKRVRNQTGIDAGRVSIGSVAVDFARQIFERFEDKIVVGVGAGEMAKLTLRHLKALTPAKLWLANRTQANAQALADILEIRDPVGGVRAFEDLDELLVEADIVLTSTAATEPIITAERFRPILRRRRFRPLFIIDIAVPRNVEPAVASLSNVYLYNVDDLQKVVAKTHETRLAQVKQADEMLFDAVRACMHQIQHRDVGQLVKALRQRLESYSDEERERTLRKLHADLPADTAERLRAILAEHDRRLINKVLHLPLSQLNQKDPNAPLGFYAVALRKLFGLDDLTPAEGEAETLRKAAYDAEQGKAAGDGAGDGAGAMSDVGGGVSG
jgi:glutamyl-tRNA reductase